MANPEKPESIEEHQQDYKEDAWKSYSLQELGNWVHNLVKRATHRKDKIKAIKDLHGAQNYLTMMASHIEEAKKQLGIPNE